MGLAIDSQNSGCAWYDKVICDGEVVKVMVELVAQHDLYLFNISGPVHLVVPVQVLREQDESGGQVMGGGGQGQEVQGTGG